MTASYRVENCPVSSQTPPATVDDDGYCTEHGWDCDDPIIDTDCDLFEFEDDIPASYTTSTNDDESGDDA